MVGDESFNSTSDSRSEKSVSMVKTGVVTVSGVNIAKMPELEKTGASHPRSTGEKFQGGGLEPNHQEVASNEYRCDGIFLNIARELSDNEKNCALNRESALKGIKNLVEESTRAFISGNYRLSLIKHKEVLDELPKHPTHVLDDRMEYTWFKYAHFSSLIEVNNYSDFINAHNSLQELKAALCAETPTYHYAVAKLLIKFYRFHLAEEEIQKCRDAMVGHDFKKHFWTGSNEVIKEASKEGLENYLQELSTICRSHHLPDATCKFEGCLSASTHPYPSREIFRSDPGFKGYVLLTCQEDCKVHYHPSCWKNIKETLTKFDKLSDKECLGKPCLTPDCRNSAGGPSVIQKIEIFGSDGNVKSQCVQDLAAEIKQKEISLKKRQRLLSDELKNEKVAIKTKQKTKKGPERSHSTEVLAISTKTPTSKDGKPLQITGIINSKQNVPAKEKHTTHQEISSSAGQNEFICSYFKMCVIKNGPMSKKKVEEEWETLSPIVNQMEGVVTKKSRIFGLLKNSSIFVIVDDLLCIKESPDKVAQSNNDITDVIQNEPKPADPVATDQDFVESPMHQNPSKQPESSKICEPMKELKPLVQVPIDIDLTSSKANVNHKDWAQENAVLDSEINEIEKELLMTHLVDQASKSNCNSSELLNKKLLDSQGKDQTKVGEVVNHHIPNTAIKPHNFLEEHNTEKKVPSTTVTDHRKVTGIPFQKSGETMPMIHQHPDGYFLVPPPPMYPPLPMPAPIRWPIEGLQPQKHIPYGSPEMFKPLVIFPPNGGLDPHYNFQPQNHKDISIQTNEKWEEKCNNGDETWVHHMQLAVNELMKKNRDLMKAKDELVKTHENEVEALKNQMATLRQSYEQYIESLKESINKNADERRRTLALEQRMKLQEQILNSTKEELRKKDFVLLEEKRLLGLKVLERMEIESSKQVTRLVTALASLPCNSKEAEAVGQAMSKWESTAEKASKAKSEFLGSCVRHQAKLIDGYGSNTHQELIIPTVEEPSGPCPLDILALKLLHEKENSIVNSAASTPISAPIGIQPFRNRNAVVVATTGTSIPTAPTSLSPVSLGARPRESTALDTPLRSWPSSHSVHSSSGGTARALSYYQKLMMELKKCYPSRTEDELRSAIKLTRRKNKNTLSGLTIERIIGMVSNVLDWWPEPIDGAMGLDKFMGWASDVTPADETFCSISKGPQRTAWISSSSSPGREGDKEDCCICLQGMSEPKTDLICSHSFHTQCIREWLSRESVCPICRKFTRMPDEFPTLK